MKNNAAVELGKLGGLKTSSLYGFSHYSKMGKISAAKKKLAKKRA